MNEWLLHGTIPVAGVGVTTLVNAGFYPAAGMYVFYGGFCVVGFIAWRRAVRAGHDSETLRRDVEEVTT